MSGKKYGQLSEQERAIVFSTCGELEGILAGISKEHELKVIPAFLWEEMTDTIAFLKERFSQLEEENEALRSAATLKGTELPRKTKVVYSGLSLCK